MSEQENKKIESDLVEKEQSQSVKVKQSDGQLEFTDSATGKTVVLNLELSKDIEGAERPLRISVDEFRAALQQVNELDLTWTGDIIPRIQPKEPQRIDRRSSPEFLQLTEKHPYLPYELGTIIRFLLMGKVTPEEVGESESEFLQKAAIVKEMVITPDFRAEFFFSHSIKVPHFIDVDWEVVVKAYENNVNGSPGIVYGLLSLSLFRPETPWEGKSRNNKQSVTVAVNERLADKLIKSLEQLKVALQNAKRDAEEFQAVRRDHAG